MNKVLCLLLMFILVTFTSCGNLNEIDESGIFSNKSNSSIDEENIGTKAMSDNDDKPEQEILFVITHINHSDGYSFDASIIDSDGNYHYLPEEFKLNDDGFNEGWYEILLDAKKTKSVREVGQSDLKTIYTFINEFNCVNNYGMKPYDHVIYDYGTYSLYSIYVDNNDNPNYKLLCTYGESTACMDSKNVQEFVNWMSDNDYFYIDDFRY